MVNKLFAVIVLYGIKLENSPTFSSLVELASTTVDPINLMVYDNSPVLQSFTKNFPNLKMVYVSDNSNPGISKAYNIAAQYALEHKKEWILLLDQDSTLPVNFFELIKRSIDENQSQVLFAPILQQNGMILSPCKFHFMKGRNFRSLERGLMPLKNVSIFNSGMVVNLGAFFEVGGYNEKIKLDFSDHCFIHRIKQRYSHFVVTSVVIEHELSSHTSDKDKITRRFVQYCEGVKSYSDNIGNSVFLFLWTFLRALKLSIRFKDVTFLRVFWQKYINSNY